MKFDPIQRAANFMAGALARSRIAKRLSAFVRKLHGATRQSGVTAHACGESIAHERRLAEQLQGALTTERRCNVVSIRPARTASRRPPEQVPEDNDTDQARLAEQQWRLINQFKV